MTKQEFITKVQPGAVQAYKNGNCLPSLALAQACLESGFGASAPGNMLFGIKWSTGCGYDSQLLWTHEYINGKRVKVQAKFRKYNSYADSILDHAKLFTKSRYKPVLEADNYKDACRAVQECGYATDPNYATQLIKMIETYNLNQWDGDYVKYSKQGITHVFEFDPLAIFAAAIKGLGVQIASKYKNFVNANFFSGASIIGWLISEGKILNRRDEYKTWKGNPKGTLMVLKDGTVKCGLMLDSEIAPLADSGKVWFCCQGFNLFPVSLKTEGMTDASIARITNRVSIGYNKSTNKIVLAVCPSSDATRALQTMKNLGCDSGICLDSGSSTNLYKDGKPLLKTASTLTNILHWKG